VPGTIGYNAIASNSDTVAGNWQDECYTADAYTYVAAAGDTVTQVAFYSGSGAGVSAEMAIYVVSAQLPAARVGSVVSVPLGATAQWYTAACSIPLTAGTRYGVAIRYATNGFGGNTMRWQTAGSNTLSILSGVDLPALPATWTHSSYEAGLISYYATVTASGISLAVDAAAHAHTASQPALVVPGVAAPDNTLHAQSAPNVTLTGGDTDFTDDFNRADTTSGTANALGPNWNVPANSWYISGNTATKVNGDHYVRWVQPMPSVDHFIEVDIPKAKVSNYMWFHLRAANNTPGTVVPVSSYEAGINTTSGGAGAGQCELGIVHANSTYTVLGRANVTYGSGGATARMRLEAVGSTIRLYIDGILHITATDSELTGSYVGLNCFAGSTGDVYYDNFRAGAYVVVPVDLTVAAGSHAHSAASVALPGGDVTLAVDVCAHAHNVESPLLSAPPPSGGGIIGYNTIGINSDTVGSNYSDECYIAASNTYVANVGEAVTQVAFYSGGVATTAELAIYEINSTPLPTNRVGSVIPISIGTAVGWYTAATNIPLTAGTRYGVAIRYSTSGGGNALRWQGAPGVNVQSNLTPPNLPPLPVTWSHGNYDEGYVSYYATVTVPTVTLAVDACAHGHVASAPDTFLPGVINVVACTHGHIATSPALTVAYTFAFPVTKSLRKWLDQNGVPIQVRALSSWGLVQRKSTANITVAVNSAADRGFNCLVVDCSAGMNIGSGWTPFTNSESGNTAWSGTAFRSTLGTLWSVEIPHLMTEATRRGMYVGVSCYAGSGSQTATKAAMAAASDAEMRLAGQRWATALAPWPNWVFHYGLDDSSGPDSKLDQFVRGIEDVHGPILCIGEPNQGADALAQWPPGAFTYFDPEEAMYQYDGGHTSDWVQLWRSTYQGDPRTPDGPTWDCEPLYIGHASSAPERLEKRYRHYALPIEGALGINNGHEDWWTFGAAGVGFTAGDTWTTAMNNVMVQDFQRGWPIWDLCNSIGWEATTTFVTTGAGTTGSTAAQGADADTAIAYFSTSRTVTVNTALLAGTGNVKIRWYDPTTGAFTTVTASEGQTASRPVTYPSLSRSDGTTDMVLVVENLERTLVVSNTSHGHTTSSPTLISGVTVDVDSAVHAHSAQDVTLTAALPTTVLVADTAHAHAAADVTLTLFVLLVDSTVHAHTVPRTRLTGGTPLSGVADAGIQEIVMRSGDQLPLLAVTVEDEVGYPLNLSDASSVTLVLTHEDGDDPRVTVPDGQVPRSRLPLPAAIIDPDEGIVSFDWGPQRLRPGVLQLMVVAEFVDGTVTAPSDRAVRIVVRPDVLPTSP
jgi:hypothetical protein